MEDKIGLTTNIETKQGVNIMKLKKGTAMLVSFSLGAMLFAGTALADMASKSGYDQLKDSLKLTSKQMASGFSNYTAEFSAVVKDNGNVLTSETDIMKADLKGKAKEDISEHQDPRNNYKSHSYYSPNNLIYYDSQNDTYHDIELTSSQEPNYMYEDAFDDDEVGDIEKIADALVGGFKDQVMVKEEQDGNKVLSGSLSQVQIPALVNAVTSFALKQEFGNNSNSNLRLAEDIFVKSVEGKAEINKDGVLDNVLASAVLSGKDKDGQEHELTVDILFKLYDINNTTVSKPDLSGKNVVKEIQDNKTGQSAAQGMTTENLQKLQGTFVNDILMEQDGKFVKAGERFIEITHIDGQTVEGRYYEQFRPGFEKYADLAREFTFAAKFQDHPYMADFDENIQTEKNLDSISFDPSYGRIYLNSNDVGLGSGLICDQEFRIEVE